MRLCMFTPRDLGLARGWPGVIEGDVVYQLAAQTLQAFFTGGGNTRRHAEYALADVELRAPRLLLLNPRRDLRARGRDSVSVGHERARLRARGGGDRRRGRTDRRLHGDERLVGARPAA